MNILYPAKPVVFLMGPTASGKTALAIDLHESQKFEIISVDSAMIYTQMDIGSAKPRDSELVLAPHHLIDFVDPKDSYSASQFANDAKQLINEIHQRDKTPLLVGGTMLYFKALRDGLAKLPQSDPAVRQSLQQQLELSGIAELHRQLSLVDPITAERLHENDTQRILRALEVYQISHKPISSWHAEQALEALPNPLLSIALAPQDRAVLHQRIAQRFDLMLQQGLLDEVASLYYRGDLSMDCPSVKCVGYRQFWEYMEGQSTLSQATEKAIIATRQLAKRQFTWLRSWENIEWFDPLVKQQYQAAKNRILTFVKST